MYRHGDVEMGFIRDWIGKMNVESRRESFYLTRNMDTEKEEQESLQIEIPYWEFQNLKDVIRDLEENDERFREWRIDHRCPTCETGLTKTLNDPCSRCEQEAEKQEQALEKRAEETYVTLGI